MIKCVIFDMDGVLFDTERIYMDIQTRIAAEEKILLPEDFFVNAIGTTWSETCEMLRKYAGSDFDYARFEKNIKTSVSARLEKEGLPLKPFVRETLEYLRNTSRPAAVASSSLSGTINRYLRLAGLEGYFDAVVGCDMVKIAKPAPDCYLMAAELLGFAPEYCVAVEDSAAGIKSAAAAGCVAVMIPDLYTPTDEIRSRCTAVFDSLKQLPEYIEKTGKEHAQWI